MKITWEDPGQTRILKQNEIDQTVEELKKHPGRWALISTGLSPSPIPWKKRGCECTTRGAEDKNGRPVRKMYVRWPAPKAPEPRAPERASHTVDQRLNELRKPAPPGACKVCKKHGTLNAKGLCRIHAPLEQLRENK